MVEQMPYGPATRQIRRFFQHLAALNPAEELNIGLAHASHARSPQFRLAEKRLALLFPQSGRDAEFEAAMRVLVQLTQRPIENQKEPAAPAGSDDALSEMREISEPATAAVLALMIRDLLTDSEFDALYAPFVDKIPVATLR